MWVPLVGREDSNHQMPRIALIHKAHDSDPPRCICTASEIQKQHGNDGAQEALERTTSDSESDPLQFITEVEVVTASWWGSSIAATLPPARGLPI